MSAVNPVNVIGLEDVWALIPPGIILSIVYGDIPPYGENVTEPVGSEQTPVKENVKPHGWSSQLCVQADIVL